MPRPPRTDIGGIPYHVINRANARARIFEHAADYRAFETVLSEAHEHEHMPILAYCVMPNHWHLVLYPPADGMLAPFMRRLSMTHTQRWHAVRNTTGTGHLYQGRYKSFLIETDAHLLQVCRYVERNPVRSGLVARSEEWQWSSLWRRLHGSPKEQALLHPWPVSTDETYLDWVNHPENIDNLTEIRASLNRGRPYGNAVWRERMVNTYHLASTIRSPGRPKQENGS